MFLSKLFAAIGSIFTGIFTSAKKAWKHLSPEIQSALLHGSAVLDTINTNIDATPDFIIEILAKKFPDLTKEKLHLGLAEVAKGFNLAMTVNDPDLETLINKIQEFLAAQKGKVWAAISHSMASIMSVVLAPADTKFAVVSSLLEYVYHAFIKKDKTETPAV